MRFNNFVGSIKSRDRINPYVRSTLRVIGAGLPRTGTMTLKSALETLLGELGHHMAEAFERKDWHEHTGTLPGTKVSTGVSDRRR